MDAIQESIDVAVPVSVAYNQWTQFEDFPSFMEGVEAVRQVDDSTLHWVAEIGGQRREWDAKITEQVPDDRIAWKSLTGTGNAGVVTFHRIAEDTTRVMLQLEFYPQDWKEKVADMTGLVKRQVTEDLRRFKKFIEARGQETGAWRGEIEQKRAG
jgi:uncharacterized membrane protein